MDAKRRAVLVGGIAYPLTGCATAVVIAKSAGLMDATGHINVFKTIAGIGKVALVTVAILDPPAGVIITTAIEMGMEIAQSMASGATQSQIDALSVHTQTINEQAAAKVVVVAKGTEGTAHGSA